MERNQPNFITASQSENKEQGKQYDVLVIGAGVAGLMGALEIALASKTVAIIEAKNRTGGRVLTIEDGDCPIELGAEFVHGNLPLTQQLLQKAGVKMYEVDGKIWQYKDGSLQQQEDFIEDYDYLMKKFGELKKDKTVAAFLQYNLAGARYSDLRFSLRNYVEGYYAADTAKASTEALCQELTKGDEEQYRVDGGYRLLVNYLENRCHELGVQFFLSQPVLQLQWKKEQVTAITEKDAFTGKQALLTVPLGVLQQEGITFYPALQEVTKQSRQLGFGHVIKVVFQFNAAFWREKKPTREKDLMDMSFLFSNEEVPTWWTHYPKGDAILTAWLGGPKAEKLHFLTKEEIQSKAIASLSRIFGTTAEHLQQKLKNAWYYNWSSDPHSCGAYSYEVVGGVELIRQLQKPVEGTLFFAGEALHHGPQIGTVEGALLSGREAAKRLLALFSS